MTFRRQVVAAAALMLASLSSARAQAPLTEKNVSMRMALAIIDGALEQCTKDGYKVSVVIVSNDGVVRASLRGDGTGPHTMEFARRKAYTARTRNQTSLEFMKLTDNPANDLRHRHRRSTGRSRRRRPDQERRRSDRRGGGVGCPRRRKG